MGLALMLRRHREALECDLAETYHVLDLNSLPARKLATLAMGLRENSRVMMAIGERRATTAEMLNAAMVDRLSLLVWSKTKDAQKGRNRPKSVLENLIGKKDEEKLEIYSSKDAEEFEARRRAIMEAGENT